MKKKNLLTSIYYKLASIDNNLERIISFMDNEKHLDEFAKGITKLKRCRICGNVFIESNSAYENFCNICINTFEE